MWLQEIISCVYLVYICVFFLLFIVFLEVVFSCLFNEVFRKYNLYNN